MLHSTRIIFSTYSFNCEMNVRTCIQCRCYCFAICVHVECALPHCVLYVLYLNGMLSYKITKYRTHHMSSDQIYIHVLDDSLQLTDDQGDSLFI